jgi:hypothetical protein
MGATALAGTGVTKITFDLYVNGVDKDSQSWTGTGATAAATAYFTDNAVDLGSLASGSALVGTSSTLTLKTVMTVTSTTANSGFYGAVIIGDPPAAKPKAKAPSVPLFANAAAGFAPAAATTAVVSASHHGANAPLALLSPRGAALA